MDSVEVRVRTIPACQMSGVEGHREDKHEASYDAKTLMGPWAFMCEEAYQRYGRGLGTGLGQRLVRKKEDA